MLGSLTGRVAGTLIESNIAFADTKYPAHPAGFSFRILNYEDHYWEASTLRKHITANPEISLPHPETSCSDATLIARVYVDVTRRLLIIASFFLS